MSDGSGEFARNAGYKNRIYHGDGKAATSTVYDNSPLDRIVRTYKPGEAYQSQGEGHYTATAYGVNSSNEVMRLELDGNGFTVSGHHTAATLYKTVTTDEDGSQLELFTDARGNNILERRKAGNNIYADTYYVYDAKNRLKVVVSPQGSTKLTNGTAYSDTCSLLRELCYIYSYDDEDRIVMKRLPGRSHEYFSYDTNGRLATYLDDAMMTEGITKLFSYDALGRDTGFRYVTGKGEYTQQQNHYDDYNASGAAAFVPVSGVVAQSDLAASTKGMLTYDCTYGIYDGSQPTEKRQRTYWYDSRGRCVQTYTAYPVGINCRTSVKYDYAGNPLTTVEQYTYGSSTLTITTGCTFDRRGRKLTEQTTVNGTALSSAVFTYDEQGRVTRTLLNGNIDITASYNLQGWMTALQAAKVNGNGVINTVLFDEILRYYDTTDSLATPLYAGKIAQIDWKRKMQIDGNDRFLYSYDPLGRLTKAEHRITELNGNSTKGSHTEQATYDRNSNILSLNAKKGIINKWQKDYTLNGNRIATVTKNFINEYTAEYDSRGNLTRIPWENLQIAYNLINLPRYISNSNDGSTTYYGYLSDGTKFKAIDNTGDGFLYTGSLRWRLQGGTITPESFAIAGGRATLEANGWTAHYYITDHLGSTRAVANTSGNAFATFDYTPYGSLLNAEDTPTGTDYLFTGKERQAKQGAGELYDSQARFMDTGGRFLSIDPMAEKFYHLSPYAYCAGDPVNLVDPDGRKIEDPDELVIKFKQNIEKKIKEITDNHALFCSIGIDEKKLKQIHETYQTILNELHILEKSDDTFKIVNNIKEDGGVTSWNNGIILIEIGNKDDYGLIGHELKHAYQFTQGEISFNAINGGGGLLYDIHDEHDAFLRQAYINAGVYFEEDFKNYLKVLNKKYSNLNTQHYNIFTKGILKTLYETKEIFRIPE